MILRVSLILVVLTSSLSAQEFKNYFFYPQEFPKKQFAHMVGISLASLPEDFVEEGATMIRGPLFGYHASYGLPANFTVDGNFTTNFITLQLALGSRWRHEFDKKWALSLGFDLSYVYGQLRQFGYDTKITTWMGYPNVTLGYKFSEFAISFKVEGIFIADLKTQQDDIQLTKEFDDLPGFSFALYIEQPLWKDNYITLGMKNNYTSFYYPAWAAFPSFDRLFWIPEVFMGIVL